MAFVLGSESRLATSQPAEAKADPAEPVPENSPHKCMLLYLQAIKNFVRDMDHQITAAVFEFMSWLNSKERARLGEGREQRIGDPAIGLGKNKKIQPN